MSQSDQWISLARHLSGSQRLSPAELDAVLRQLQAGSAAVSEELRRRVFGPGSDERWSALREFVGSGAPLAEAPLDLTAFIDSDPLAASYCEATSAVRDARADWLELSRDAAAECSVAGAVWNGREWSWIDKSQRVIHRIDEIATDLRERLGAWTVERLRPVAPVSLDKSGSATMPSIELELSTELPDHAGTARIVVGPTIRIHWSESASADSVQVHIVREIEDLTGVRTLARGQSTTFTVPALDSEPYYSLVFEWKTTVGGWQLHSVQLPLLVKRGGIR